jgi:hypothetical protein
MPSRISKNKSSRKKSSESSNKKKSRKLTFSRKNKGRRNLSAMFILVVPGTPTHTSTIEAITSSIPEMCKFLENSLELTLEDIQNEDINDFDNWTDTAEPQSEKVLRNLLDVYASKIKIDKAPKIITHFQVPLNKSWNNVLPYVDLESSSMTFFIVKCKGTDIKQVYKIPRILFDWNDY